MEDKALPQSTDFIRLHGKLAEWSSFACEIPGGEMRLEEHPPTPGHVGRALEELGIKDEAEGKESYEIHLELSASGTDQLELIVARPTRRQAIGDGRKLEEVLIKRGHLPGNPKTHILSYPSEDTIVPAMLWVDTELTGVGRISVSAAADTLVEALRLLQSVMPGASMDS